MSPVIFEKPAELLTIVMVAKNAERTIARAIRSALAAGPFPIMLLDHGSTDDTVAIAQDLARRRLRVVDGGICPTLGAVRQMAVVETQTPFGLWLDSDDEMLPDRGHAMLRSLQRNDADLVYDEAELCSDGSTGSEKILRIPDFIRAEGGLVRSFERNFLPGLFGGFRRDAALTIGYDPEWQCAEDYDFLLRAIAGGLKVHLCEQVGYRYYHYSDSVSRNLDMARKYFVATLARFSDQEIEDRYTSAGMKPEEARWAAISKHLNLENAGNVMALCQESRQPPFDGDHLIPTTCLLFEDSLNFADSIAHYWRGQYHSAMQAIEKCSRMSDMPEMLNNLAIYHLMLDEREISENLFHRALALQPNYRDARINLAQLRAGATQPYAITRVPLRRDTNRDQYDN